jgi:hypothetical protein
MSTNIIVNLLTYYYSPLQQELNNKRMHPKGNRNIDRVDQTSILKKKLQLTLCFSIEQLLESSITRRKRVTPA